MDMNLVTSAFTDKKGWRIISTSTALATGTNMDCKVLGTIDTTDAYIEILPGTPHEVCLHLEETLMVGNPDLPDLLVGNRQMTPTVDSLTKYPFAQLHWHPNLIESTSYAITIPMAALPFLHGHTPGINVINSTCSGTLYFARMLGGSLHFEHT